MELLEFHRGGASKPAQVLLFFDFFYLPISRNLPIAILVSCLSVTVIYVLTNVALYTVVSPDDMNKSNAVCFCHRIFQKHPLPGCHRLRQPCFRSVRLYNAHLCCLLHARICEWCDLHLLATFLRGSARKSTPGIVGDGQPKNEDTHPGGRSHGN